MVESLEDRIVYTRRMRTTKSKLWEGTGTKNRLAVQKKARKTNTKTVSWSLYIHNHAPINTSADTCLLSSTQAGIPWCSLSSPFPFSLATGSSSPRSEG